MIRVVLPAHLRTLAQVNGEVQVEVEGPATQRSILDALEKQYPMLQGTLRDHVTQQRRPFVRFFVCEEDWSHESPDAPLPEAIVTASEPFLIVGAIAGGAPEKASKEEDPRLTRMTKICMALPETTRECNGQHARFSVRKKSFAYYLSDHHGDGIVGLSCKVGPGDNAALVKAQPARFYMPQYVASKGWVGLRFDRGEIDWDEARELVTDSYRRVAPKTLASRVKITGG